ncbi:MAG: hypothetical protein O2873_12125 [Proteobacteria bacterium]|nr:hypothetical protein [Pseudomonadota bacterium]
MVKPKSAAAKKAMAERGTFKVEANTDYGKPYSRAVSAAVAPMAHVERAASTILSVTSESSLILRMRLIRTKAGAAGGSCHRLAQMNLYSDV